MENKKAITLIEILIVVMILAILSMVWFTSFTSYLAWVRDSTRIVELENIETSLETYSLQSWFYPEPEDWIDVTYSGGLVWTQWVFWNTISSIIWYSMDVADPLTWNKYTYSLKNTKKEFSLVWVLEENPSLVSDSWFANNTYAAGDWKSEWTAIVKWNYNWVLNYVKNWSNNYLLIIPSIIATDLSVSSDLQFLIDNNKLVYEWYTNLPYSYNNSIYKLENWVNYFPEKILVYSWSVSDFKDENERMSLLYNIKKSFSGTINKNSSNKFMNSLFRENIDLIYPDLDDRNLSCDLINNKLNYKINCNNIVFTSFYVIEDPDVLNNISFDWLSWLKVHYIYQDWTNLWFWTSAGPLLYDITAWVWTTFSDTTWYEITVIEKDSSGNIWFWTSDKWLLMYDNTTFINYQSNFDYEDEDDDDDDNQWTLLIPILIAWLPSNAIYSIKIEAGWNLVIGTHNGWSYYDPVTMLFQDFYVNTEWDSYSHKENRIKNILVDSNNYIWLWTDEWAYLYQWILSDITNWSFTLFDGNNWLPYEWDENEIEVSSIFEDSSNNIWIWTEEWIWKLWWATTYNPIAIYTTDTWEGLADNEIETIFQDVNTWNMWFWTESGVSTLTWSVFTNYTKDVNWADLGTVFFIYQDPNGLNILWTSNWSTTLN